VGRLTVLAVTVSLLTSCAGDGRTGDAGGPEAEATTGDRPGTTRPAAPGTTDAAPATTGPPPVSAVPGELPPAPSILSPADDGATYALAPGAAVDLVVAGTAVPDLEVEGTSIEVVDTMNIDDSGQRQWELRAVAEGTTVLRGGGAVPFTLTLSVYS
jgi:hypothetical protein